MDAIDRKLIAELRKNPRRKTVDLANVIGLSRTATQVRLEKLHSNGIIVGYDVILNNDIGGDRCSAFASVEYEKGILCKAVIPEIATIPDIISCHSTAGTPDLLIYIEAATIEKLTKAVETLSNVKGISSVSTHIVLETHINRKRQVSIL